MDRKQIITIPPGIKYISDFVGYELPKGHCIIDKGVTGCGFTEYCLRNDTPLVLCSPRKVLLKNKSEQHQDDLNICYIENKRDIETADELISWTSEYKRRLRSHLEFCIANNLPCKFLTTYDSFPIIVDILNGKSLLPRFQIVVDEFQSIFVDSLYRSEVENDFINLLKWIDPVTGKPICRDVVYLSATPMLDKYLDKLDYFKDLDYYIIDWTNSEYVEKVDIDKIQVSRSLSDECSKIIKKYKSGDYPTEVDDNGNVVYSNEAVFYFNSVSEIVRIISKNELTKDEVNIICSDTPANRKTLKKINMTIGSVPLECEKDHNKMFTFCTSTVYIGADFYSDCAKSYVFANPNINSLAVDIMLDLPQIAGRQRCANNIFKNVITVYYQLTHFRNLSDKTEFDQLQEMRIARSNRLMAVASKLEDSPEELREYIITLKDAIKTNNYTKDYISFSKLTNRPVINYLIKIAQERAWDVIQDDYLNSINVTRTINSVNRFNLDFNRISKSKIELVKNFVENGLSLNHFNDRLKAYCEFCDSYKGDIEIMAVLGVYTKGSSLEKFYKYFGTKGCRALSYSESNLNKRLLDSSKHLDIRKILSESFKENHKYLIKDVKEMLKGIYGQLGIMKTAKASDLENYFQVAKNKVIVDGKSQDAYRIIKLRE